MSYRKSEIYYFRPVIPLLLSMISGIAMGTWFPDHRVWAYLLISIGALTVLHSIKKRKTALITPLILFIGLGYISIQSWTAPRFPSNHIIHFFDTHPWKIIGIVDTSVAKYSNRQKLILRTESIEGNNRSFDVVGKIRLTVSGDGPGLQRGDRIVLFSKIKSIRNFNNPGGFNYKRYMAFKKVWGTAYVSAQRVTLLKRNSGKKIGTMIADIRSHISDLIDKTGQGEEQSVLKALIIGNRNAISKDLRNTFNRTGVGHLLAISGLHIGIVATTAFLFFRWILSHLKLFLWNAWTQKGAVLLSVFPVLLYGLISGMSPSTQRAVIMVIVFLMAFLFERDHDPMNTLALAAMLILMVHPPSLYSISFQLSFAAVLAIIYGLSRVKNPWKSSEIGIRKQKRFRIATKLFYFFMVSVFAIFGTLPFVMFYFNQVSLVGIPANFIMVPLVGFVVVPLGLLAVFLYPLTVYGALICLKISSLVMAQALHVIDFFADLPFAAIKTVTPTYLEIACFYILFWVVLSLKYMPSKIFTGKVESLHKENKVQGKNFIQKSSTVVVLLVMLVFSIDVCYWMYYRFWHDDLRVTMIDVGHGNAALLELPHGYNILVDGGGFSDNRIFDIGASIIAPFLWQKKIKTVDTLVLSHPNSDHLNGLIYIAENFNVKNVWTNREAANTFGYRKFMEAIKNNRIYMPGYKKISGIHHINGVRINICYPPIDFIEKRKKERWRNLNNNSLVLKASFGSESFLFPGDIETRAEYELVSTAGDELKSTVLLAPHHGSKTSSSHLFLEKVAPEVVVISSGWKSRFGFPHPSVLKRYKKEGCRVLGTARNGAISMSTDGRTLMVRPMVTGKKAFF